MLLTDMPLRLSELAVVWLTVAACYRENISVSTLSDIKRIN